MTKFLLPEEDHVRRKKAKKSKFPQPKYFVPKNPRKYIGDHTKIVARSNLERRFYSVFDESPNVIQWGSEEMHVEYWSALDEYARPHRYFPDVVVKLRTRGNVDKIYMIEIKPKSQCSPPKKRNSKKYLVEAQTWQKNQEKWLAARKYCDQRKITFYVLNEDHLGGF